MIPLAGKLGVKKDFLQDSTGERGSSADAFRTRMIASKMRTTGQGCCESVDFVIFCTLISTGLLLAYNEKISRSAAIGWIALVGLSIMAAQKGIYVLPSF